MDEDRKDPEIESMLKGVKLKEPSQKDMTNFLSGVHEKIDRGYGNEVIGFRQIGLIFVVGVALAGLIYFISTRSKVEPAHQVETLNRMEAPLETPLPASVLQNPAGEKPLTRKPLSLEEEMAVLEAFEDEFGDETTDLFGDSEVLEELATLDELEFSVTTVPGQA